jgi:hypothetical protein
MSTESLEMEDEPKVTLFPTRLREFEEKNDLVFKHFLQAKNQMRRHSDAMYFGDQYVRRSSVADMAPPEFILEDKFEVMRNLFRRTSAVDRSNRLEVLDTKLIPLIFQRLGQEYDEEELNRWIKSNDPHGLGVVDFNHYQRICVHFLKDKRAILRAQTEEFSFNNLTRKDSSEHSSNSDLSTSE